MLTGLHAINLFTLLGFGKKQMGIQGFKIVARQRARLVGKMQAIETNIAGEHSQLAVLRAKIAAFDEVLREQGIDIDADAYAPAIRPTPHLYYFEHGELTATCLNLLRTQCRPLSTIQLFEALLVLKKPVWHNLEDPRKVRQSIKNLMKKCAERGLVVRAGNADDVRNDPGLWALPEHALVPWDSAAIEVIR